MKVQKGLMNGYKSAALGTCLRDLLIDLAVLIHQGNALAFMEFVFLIPLPACNH